MRLLTLHSPIKKSEIERAKLKPTHNVNAYDLYLRALTLAHSFRQEQNRAALELLNQAIALDPTFAQRWRMRRGADKQ